MSKPFWRNAPAWAQWLAMDADGRWAWYAMKPEWAQSGQWANRKGTKWEYAMDISGGNRAADTLESRL